MSRPRRADDPLGMRCCSTSRRGRASGPVSGGSGPSVVAPAPTDPAVEGRPSPSHPHGLLRHPSPFSLAPPLPLPPPTPSPLPPPPPPPTPPMTSRRGATGCSTAATPTPTTAATSPASAGRLPDLVDLGVTAIWLTPVYRPAATWFEANLGGKTRGRWPTSTAIARSISTTRIPGSGRCPITARWWTRPTGSV